MNPPIPAPAILWSEHRIGMLAFLALFPGFFFYHTLLGLGMMGAFLGGYFAPVSVLVAGPLCALYLARIRRERSRIPMPDLLFMLYLAYFLAVVAVNAGAGANRVIVLHHMLGILFIVNMFLICRMCDFGRRDFRLACLACLFGMSAVVLGFSVDGSFYLASLNTAINPESLATYQGFSRSYLVSFMVLIAFTGKLHFRLLLYVLAALTLFVNTARSEFVAMLVLIPIIELYHARHKMLVTAVLIIVVLLVLHQLEDLLRILPSNRILELLDLSQSTSANKRHHLTMYAMHTIANYPVLGDYASYSPGFYSHNILSAWVDLGLFGFLFVLSLLILPFIPMFFKGYFSSNRSGYFILAFSLACITLLLLATSHYFTDMLIGATLGAFSAYRYGKHHANHCAHELGTSAPRHPDLHQAMP